jgi:DNA helicase II / ATP-dependent DNA helicase PcrA
MSDESCIAAVNSDDHVEETIRSCLNLVAPKSFFLYAGAGSGKTKSLANALEFVRYKYGEQLGQANRRVAVITYTNAAADEISSRLKENSAFSVSTIHSFCWTQIQPFHRDIQEWLLRILPEEISELETKQATGRATSKAAMDRTRSIAAKKARIEWLSTPRHFTYNPNGDNFGQASLSHAEVLKITADFISSKPSMQAILINRFPFLLIDESQDTNKHLMAAFFALESANRGRFSLGLLGDTMQRIYSDGMPNLGGAVPSYWEKPAKIMNHRSGERIVKLGNALRASVDGQRQMARGDRGDGTVRLFVASSSVANKPALEARVIAEMAKISGDNDWKRSGDSIKILTLEHHMAASRMGFIDLFSALDSDGKNGTGLRTGELAGLKLFSERVAPLVAAALAKDDFAVMAILRDSSPLLRRDYIEGFEDKTKPLAEIQAAVKALLEIDKDSARFLDILECIAKHRLFEVPKSLKAFLPSEDFAEEPPDDVEIEEETSGQDVSASETSLKAWRAFLEGSYVQIQPYTKYISNLGEFGTHQGVKGLQFERVLVIMDDSEARGFMFSYEKLFQSTPTSTPTGEEESGIDRTRRLLYVTSTRAKKGLALVAYAKNPKEISDSVVRLGWLKGSEIIHLE